MILFKFLVTTYKIISCKNYIRILLKIRQDGPELDAMMSINIKTWLYLRNLKEFLEIILGWIFLGFYKLFERYWSQVAHRDLKKNIYHLNKTDETREKPESIISTNILTVNIFLWPGTIIKHVLWKYPIKKWLSQTYFLFTNIIFGQNNKNIG